VNRIAPIAVAIALVALLSASLAMASRSEASESAATVAKKKQKKAKKKKRKKPKAPTAPSAPGNPGPPGPPLCANDPFEPDGASEARPLEFTEEDRSPHDGVICAADSDWFVVTLPPSGSYVVTADPEDGFDASMAVISQTGNVLERVNGMPVGAPEETTVTNLGDEPEDRFIEVTEGHPGETGSYTVSGRALPPDPGPPCEGDDSAEVDDDPSSATVIDWPGTTTSLDRFLCPGDRDFFEITVPPGLAFQFSANTEFDIALEVYDGGEVPILVEDSQYGVLAEDVQITNQGGSPLTRWIAVVGATPTETGRYWAAGDET
jgi:hypothetical protein